MEPLKCPTCDYVTSKEGMEQIGPKLLPGRRFEIVHRDGGHDIIQALTVEELNRRMQIAKEEAALFRAAQKHQRKKATVRRHKRRLGT